MNKPEPLLSLICDLPYSVVPAWYGTTRRTLHLDLIYQREKSQRPRPLLLWICGGGFQQVDHHVWIPILCKYAEQGFAVASVEYRVGISGQWPAALDDVWMAVRYIREHADELSIDSKRIAVMGESAGGYLAISVGLGIRRPRKCAPIQACVDYYGIADLYSMADFEKKNSLNTIAEFMNGTPEERVENYRMANPIENITSVPTSFLIVHGTEDRRVPISQSQLLQEKLKAQGIVANLYTVAGAIHGDSKIYQPDVSKHVTEFLVTTLF